MFRFASALGVCLLALVAASGCPSSPSTCRACVTSSDCSGEKCVQYAGSDYCGHGCSTQSDCGATEDCLPTATTDGTSVRVCVPRAGNCGGRGCGSCTGAEVCDPIAGACVSAGTDGGGGPVGYDGGVGPQGGTVSRLYFAVVGDTRPRYEDDTAHYPTAVITKIYQDLAALQPPPQFVVTTGDYQFASTSGTESAPQLALYLQARAHYPGVVFPVMGNHECTGATAQNCAALTTPNLTQYLQNLQGPIGQTQLYYSVDVNDEAGQWTSKFLFTACNAWSPDQKSWLLAQLARPTSFTFIVRHMALGSNGPCNTEMDPLLTGQYTALLAGHSHTVSFDLNARELIEGVGGAPLAANSNYGYALVTQEPAGGFTITQYDYSSNKPVASWTLP